ncbi:MmcQ/YjbR family DNA-binding protein [Actinomarinicola tropica]|uniref:MmcQ/YjbR family DNA-binding protein n=1 Tax=Actinomarinicola tropica TaxID=2789776 RepID=A0A5Q2RRF4_9ACTN|nr:MmcQ/YjbR family DNA-binding protein [Actinomarinicola tropica]QGG96480.1 MmcQ/YjbR family DNA-binding protein [Actinomarinicola tropica]
MSDYSDPPAEYVEALRPICLGLPETREETAWAGTRWMVRQRNFAQVLGVDRAGGHHVVLTFRSQGQELQILQQVGHPFYRLGWGRDVLGMVLDDATDWDEVQELVTESYCVLAPKKLVAMVGRPDIPESS